MSPINNTVKLLKRLKQYHGYTNKMKRNNGKLQNDYN